MNIKNFLCLLTVLAAISLFAQSPVETRKAYNQLLAIHFGESQQPIEEVLDNISFEYLGCGELPFLGNNYFNKLSEQRAREFNRIILKHGCHGDFKFPVDSTANVDKSKKQLHTFYSNYLMRYEQLFRDDSAHAHYLDSISFNLLNEVLHDTSLPVAPYLWPVLAHGSDKIPFDEIDTYKALLIKQVESGHLIPFFAASLIDRQYYNHTGKQFYGTMTVRDELFPLHDCENIDSLRSEFHMPPLGLYLRKRGFEIPDCYD